MNIVTATFSSGCRQVAADEKLWQWDQGQILQIVGLDLPDAYQVEFSNQPVRGSAAPMIGGPDGVEIPDVYLTTGKPIYAFVVLHTGEDDRETEYKITIPVNTRPQPTNEQPTPEQQGVIDQLIAALNAGVERAEDAADEAEGAADDAATQAQAAAQSASSSASYAGDAAAQAGLAAAAKVGAEAAQAAAELAQGSAEAFATAAGVAKAAAETAQGKAEDAQAAAESAKAGALAAKAAAETAQGKAEDAQEAAEQAAQDAHVEYDLLAGQVTAQGQTIAQHGQAIAQNTENIADLDTELARQKSAIEDLEDLTNRKAGMLVDTASGSIASFTPDVTIDNLLGLTVAVEPVQDLHGYDSPWPAGGGKNLLPLPTNSTYVSVDSDGTITVNGTVSSTTTINIPVNLPTGTYTLSANNPVADSSIRLRYLNGNGSYDVSVYLSTVNLVATTTLTEDVSRFWITLSAKTYNNLKMKLQVESGSTATAWSPYSNICPISGWSEVNVWRTGKNLLNADAFQAGLAGITIGDDINAITASTRYIHSYIIPAQSGIAFSIKSHDLDKVNFYTVNRYVGRKLVDRVLVTLTDTNTHTNIYAANLYDYVRINIGAPTDVVADFANADVQLEIGTIVTPYEAGTGRSISITLGQTVYGGTLDVTNGTNESAFGIVDLGTLTWTYRGNGVFTSVDLAGYSKRNSDICYCSAYKGVGGGAIANLGDKCIQCGNSYYATGAINIKDTAYSDAAIFKAAMSGVMLCYELATPIVIDLDPVQIATIAGQTNNVWSNAGDVSVTYAADIKAYIDRMNQPTEDDMIANSLIAANKYFTINNRLFLSTASIAAGAMIIPGTNCQETSLAAALNALNA